MSDKTGLIAKIGQAPEPKMGVSPEKEDLINNFNQLNKEIRTRRKQSRQAERDEAKSWNKVFNDEQKKFMQDKNEMSVKQKIITKNISHTAWKEQEENQNRKKDLMKEGYLF